MVHEVLAVVMEFEESLHRLLTIGLVSSQVIRAVRTIAVVGASLVWSVKA